MDDELLTARVFVDWASDRYRAECRALQVIVEGTGVERAVEALEAALQAAGAGGRSLVVELPMGPGGDRQEFFLVVGASAEPGSEAG